jgi:hypothetical protein
MMIRSRAKSSWPVTVKAVVIWVMHPRLRGKAREEHSGHYGDNEQRRIECEAREAIDLFMQTPWLIGSVHL